MIPTSTPCVGSTTKTSSPNRNRTPANIAAASVDGTYRMIRSNQPENPTIVSNNALNRKTIA